MNLRKLWLVASNTYRQQVRSALFLIMTFALPALAVAAGALPILLSERASVVTLGWVDRSGALDFGAAQTSATGMLLLAYADEGTAAQALAGGELDAYLVIPEAYLAGASPVYHAQRAPSDRVTAAVRLALRHALAPDAPRELLERLGETVAWEFRDLDTGVRLHQGIELFLWTVSPAALGMLFAFMLLTTINHMGPAIIREKEERAMEMVLTSLRPVELVGGKIVGLSLLTLTQAVVWGVGAAVAIRLAWLHEGAMGTPRLPWESLAWGGALAIPCYLLYGALGAALGILAGDREQAKQIAGLLAMLGVAPVWLVGLILGRPNGSLAVGLTLVPFFAPVVAWLRMAMATIPRWQLWASLALLWVSVGLGVAMVARLFRAASLLYGQRLTPGQIWRALMAR